MTWSTGDRDLRAEVKAARARFRARHGMEPEPEPRERVGVLGRGQRVECMLPTPEKVGHRYRIQATDGAVAVVSDGMGSAPYLIRDGEEWVFVALVDALAQRRACEAGLALAQPPLAWVVAVSPVRR